MVSLIYNTRNQKPKKYKNEETETKSNAHLVRYRFKIRGGSLEGIKTMEERIYERDESFKSGVKGRGSDRR